MKRGQKTLQKPAQNGNNTGLRTRNGTLSYLRRHWMFYAMLALPVLYYFLFCYRAMPGVVIAFKDYNIFKGIWDSPWVGLEFFERVAQSDTFWRSVRNTMVLNILGLVVGFPLPIILALFLNEISNAIFKKSVQTIIYLPHFISWSVIGGMMYQFFASSGLINTVVKALGGEAVPFLTNKPWWIFTYFIVGVWKSIGWNTIIYLSAMTGIDQEIYEAARVDGCSRFRMMTAITVPCIKDTIAIMLILAILLAQLLNNQHLKFKGFFRTCVFLPCATSLVSYSLIFKSLFATDGLINSILVNIGILEKNYNFLGNAARLTP